MWDNYVGNAIRRGNRNLLACCGVLVAILAMIALASERYIYNCLMGPFPATKEALLAITEPDKTRQYYVTIDNIETIRTGFTYVVTDHGKRTTEAEFLYGKLLEKILLIKWPVPDGGEVSRTPPPTRFEGSLEDIDPNLRTKLTSSPRLRTTSADDVLLPFLLDASYFKGKFWAGLALMGPVALFALGGCIVALRRMADIRNHPLIAKLEKLGQPAEVVALQIDQESKQPIAPPTKTAMVTRNFVLNRTIFGLRVLPLQDIIWAYQMVTQHRTNFVPTGKTYGTVVWDRAGKSHQIQGNKAGSVDLVRMIAQQAPWVIVGFREDLKTQVQKDLQSVLTAVDARKAQAARQA